MLTKKINRLPARTGVYLFKNKKAEVIYVGKALNLKDRIKSYFQKPRTAKNNLLVNEIQDVNIIEVPSDIEALILEANLIKKYQPRHNILLKDGKSFLYIIITNEEYPRILTTRKEIKGVSIRQQYGPFPSSRSLRAVIKIIRKIFPFCTQSPSSHKPCFYSQINLCNPCPALIKKSSNPSLGKTRYHSNIDYIQEILEGKISSLIDILKKQLVTAVKTLNFEEAQVISEKIKQLNYICTPRFSIGYFLEDANFLSKTKNETLKELLSLLQKDNPQLTKLGRIEGIDISNIIGQQATGSLVVFINGQRQPSLYKRFKLSLTRPNDVLMIDELIKRRFAHKEWNYPDLLIVDGGIPQVSQVIKTLKANRIDFHAVIGLAKHDEKIIIRTENTFKTISFSRNIKILQLIQEIRDEAHRFARKYHHLLRKKLLTKEIAKN